MEFVVKNFATKNFIVPNFAIELFFNFVFKTFEVTNFTITNFVIINFCTVTNFTCLPRSSLLRWIIFLRKLTQDPLQTLSDAKSLLNNKIQLLSIILSFFKQLRFLLMIIQSEITTSHSRTISSNTCNKMNTINNRHQNKLYIIKHYLQQSYHSNIISYLHCISQ